MPSTTSAARLRLAAQQVATARRAGPARAPRRPRRARRRSAAPPRRRDSRSKADDSRREPGERRHLDHRRTARPAAPRSERCSASQRHEVDRRERGGRRAVDVRAVGRRRGRARASSRRTGAACIRSTAAGAVLVVLHGDERRLRLALEPRHDARLRVGLLEVVDRAVRDVLAQLPELALARTGATTARCRAPARAAAAPGRLDVVAARGVARAARRGTAARARARKRSRSGSHSSASSTPGERAVVQLVAEVQRELQVLAVRVGVGHPGRQVRRGSPPQDLEQRRAERAARRGERGDVEGGSGVRGRSRGAPAAAGPGGCAAGRPSRRPW